MADQTQKEIDERRKDDLKRVVETEAAILLLLRGSQRAVSGIEDPVLRAEALYRLSQQAIKEGWRQGSESAYEATTGQILDATGHQVDGSPDDVFADIEDEADAAAARGAHGIAGRELAGELGQAGALGLNLAMVAVSEAATAYNTTRSQVIDRLPRRVKEDIWLRRDTAGDRRVCENCSRLDGLVAPASEGISPAAPLHPKCRCTDTVISRQEAEESILAGMAQREPIEPAPAAARQANQPAIPAAPAAGAKSTRTTAAKPPKATKTTKTTKTTAAPKTTRTRATSAQAAAKKAAAEEAKAAKATAAAAKREAAAAAKAERAKLAAEKKAAAEAKRAATAAKKTTKPTGTDKLVQRHLKDVEKERTAIQAKLDRVEANIASGKPDKWNFAATYRAELKELADKEAGIRSAGQLRAASQVTADADASISARLLTREQRDAISGFTGNEYTSIRAAQSGRLSTFGGPGEAKFRASIAKKGKLLEQSIADNVQVRAELWRGITVDAETAAKILKADTLDWLGCTTSTSLERAAAERFALVGGDATPILFRVQNGRGLPIYDLGIPREREVLMSGASKFRRVGTPVKQGGRWVVDLEQVEAKAASKARSVSEEKAAERAAAKLEKDRLAAEKRAAVQAKRDALAKAKADAAAQRAERAAARAAEKAAKDAAKATKVAAPKTSARVVIDKTWEPPKPKTVDERRASTDALKKQYGKLIQDKKGVLALKDDGAALREATRKHVGDTLGLESWEARHARVNWDKVEVTSTKIPSTYAAGHDWDGTVLVHASRKDEFLGGLRSGDMNQLKNMIHEELHGHSPLASSAYDMVVGERSFTLKGASAIEESTTEYLASKSVGMTWIQSTHPYRVIGDDIVGMISEATGTLKNDAIKLFDRAAQYTRRQGAPIADTPKRMAQEFAAGVAPNDAKARAALVKSLLSYERTF